MLAFHLLRVRQLAEFPGGQMRRTRYSSRTCFSIVCALALTITTTAPVRAQSFQGGVRGTLKDAQGIIPGVTVELINAATGQTRETLTNETGQYSFPALDPTRYTLRVQVQGFKPYENANVLIGTQQFMTLDIALEVGSIEENITVTGQSPLIETTNASQGGTLDSSDFKELPSEGRSVFILAALTPTVVASGNAHYNRMQDQSGNSALSMGGGAVRSNNFLVDGFPTTDVQNRSSINPSMEALQDARVQVHTYDAEMGRTGGGVMNMAARAGSNRLEATGYTIFRPESLQAQLLIPKLNHETFRPEYWRNAGGGIGGPIFKNRTFFWFAGERYTDLQPQASTFSVPSMATRLGDFSALTRSGRPFYLKDPLSSGSCSSTTGGPGCFPGNIIPSSRLNYTGSKIAAYMPQPDRDVDDGTANFSKTDLLPSHAYQWTLKLNHNFSNAVAMSVFYLRQVTAENSANYNPVYKFVGSQFLLNRADHTFVVNNTWVMNSSTVLTLRGGWNEFQDNNVLPVPFDAASLWPNNPSFTSQFRDSNRFPTTSLTGYRGTGWSNRSDNTYYQYRFQRCHQQADRLAQPESRRRLPHPRRAVVQLWRIDRHVFVRRPVHGQRPGRHAARVSLDRQHPDLRRPRRLHQVLRRILSGRLACRHEADPQLRSPDGAGDQPAGTQQPDHDRLCDDDAQPAQ